MTDAAGKKRSGFRREPEHMAVDHKPSISRRATPAVETPCAAHRGQVSPEAKVDACILNGCLWASWGGWGAEKQPGPVMGQDPPASLPRRGNPWRSAAYRAGWRLSRMGNESKRSRAPGLGPATPIAGEEGAVG